MSKMIFISLPVADLDASVAFYKALGFVNEPHFTDETAACMVWSEAIKLMLVTHAKWRTFSSRPIPPSTSSEVALNLSCERSEEHTSELQSLMRISYAVFCLTKNTMTHQTSH